MSTQSIGRSASVDDDEYRHLWATLQDLQSRYFRIDLRLDALPKDIDEELTDLEAETKWHTMLDLLLTIWKSNETSAWLPSREE